MPTTNIDYAAQLDYQHFIVPMLRSAITLEDAGTAAANQGALLSTWLDTSQALSGIGVVSASGTGSSFEILAGTGAKTVTNAALTSNVVTLTLSAAPGVSVGGRVYVGTLTNSAFAAIDDATYTVTAVSTTAPFSVSFAFTGTTIASAACGGTVTPVSAYALNGTGKPIQLLNITGSPLQTNTSDESVITHDQVTRGSAISIGTNTTRSAAFKGMTVHKAVDHKMLQVLDAFGVAEKLAVKYLRVGPGGTTEKKLCYANVNSAQEEGDAGALAKHGFSLQVLGSVYTVFDQNAA